MRNNQFRIHHEERIIKNRKKLISRNHYWNFEKNKIGMFRKRHPYDCGNSRCRTCHSEKIDKVISHRDMSLYKSFQDQLRFIDEDFEDS